MSRLPRRAFLGMVTSGLAASAVELGRSSLARAHDEATPRVPPAPSLARGIYLSQGTLQTEEKLQGFLRLCTAFGVDTLVVDLAFLSPRYRFCVKAIEQTGLTYVPRIIVFPEGGTEETVLRRDFWDTRLRLVDTALELGARKIQLDYIRYRVDRAPHRQNAFDILRVVRFFSERIRAGGAELELAVFGDAAGGPSDRIGQDLRLLAPYVDGICPMVYPSHYRPYDETWKIPRQVVSSSVRAAQRLMGRAGPPVTAYVEMFNFRRAMTEGERAVYIRSQLQGAADAGARGWYAWSSTNSYGLLFDLLAIYGRALESPTSGEAPPGPG